MGHPAARSQLALALHLGVLLAVLRGANEHLDQVVVQAVEELTLKGPLELRVVQIAGMKLAIVGVDLRLAEARAENDLDSVTLRAGAEVNQRVFIELQVTKNTGESVDGHRGIVEEAWPSKLRRRYFVATPDTGVASTPFTATRYSTINV